MEEVYGVTRFDATWTAVLRKVRGTKRVPRFLYRYSKKKYGINDNLSRYWFHKYLGVPVGKYTWGHNHLESAMIKRIGAFCSIASNQHIAPNGHRMDYVTTWNTGITYPTPPV